MEEFGTVGVAEVVFEQWFEASRERVWRALTDPDELAGWLAPAEIDMRVGGSVVLRFEDGDERGTITELREPEVIAYTWNEGETDSLVRFELEPDDGGTRLILRHTFEAEVDLSSFGGGWHQHLEQLIAQVAGMPIAWDTNRYRKLQSEYERRAQQLREAELAKKTKERCGAEILVELRPESSDDTRGREGRSVGRVFGNVP
jgi:uncharacterized protein YndB with AHSA1/START domain